MKQSGLMTKMQVKLESPVQYSLVLGGELVFVTDKVGEQLRLRHTGNINCIHCGRKTKKTFNQGYCFPCLRALAQCDMCIMKPEQCHYEEGTCREPQWGLDNCFQTHYVYLANSSGVKVGITRHTQIPTRWIDQGAVQALPILKVNTRLLSGLCEVAIKEYVSDKTQWQRMLKGDFERVDLTEYRDDIFTKSEKVINELAGRFGKDSVERLETEKMIEIEYPILEHPAKVKSLNFDKTPEVGGKLMGIKGQYLIFDTGVINMRKFGGYEIEIEY